MSADTGKYTVFVLLDLSAAVDTVDHEILTNRLEDLLGISGPALSWFSSYLVGGSFSVGVNHQRLNPADESYGVPPLLFLLYILPFGGIIQQFNDVCYHLFADDLQLYCSFKALEAHKLSSLLSCLSHVK